MAEVTLQDSFIKQHGVPTQYLSPIPRGSCSPCIMPALLPGKYYIAQQAAIRPCILPVLRDYEFSKLACYSIVKQQVLCNFVYFV